MYSLVGMALDLPALLSESTFSMPGKKITLAIRKPYQPTFYGPDEVFQGRHALAVIQPPDGIWEAGAQPDPAELQSIYKNIWSLRGLSYVILLLVTGMVFYLMSARERLAAGHPYPNGRAAGFEPPPPGGQRGARGGRGRTAAPA
ncbi:hypothetical protein LJK87_36325 [Paenibacillus sp. P25]|nr:hypothetical protein LJK87_36325 [Paenibacillus sp. P25]